MSDSPIDVALALVWRAGCVLVTRRRTDAHLGGYWEFPGGKMAPGEDAVTCAEREALEEVGVACRAVRRLSTIEYRYPDRAVRLHPIECEYVGGPPRPLEVTDWAWVTPEELDRYEFPPANAPLLAEIRLRRERRQRATG